MAFLPVGDLSRAARVRGPSLPVSYLSLASVRIHMADILGPSCGIPAFDDAARAFALDLFVDPRGIQALARYWLAVFADRPQQPMPAPSFCALLEHFRDIALAESREAAAMFDLALDGYETDGRELSFVLRLFAADKNLAVSYEFLAPPKAARRKSLRALQHLLASLSPPQRAPAATPCAFANHTLGGLRGEFRVSGFCHNAMLAFYFNPIVFAVVATAEYVRAIVRQPPLTAQPGLLDILLLPVAHALVEWAQAMETRDPDATDRLIAVAQALADHDARPTAAATLERIEALADAELARAHHLYRAVHDAWNTSIHNAS